MILCEHHESDACLELVGGELEIDDRVTYAELEYECSEHGLEGTYTGLGRVQRVSGALVLLESRGTPIDEQRVGGESR